MTSTSSEETSRGLELGITSESVEIYRYKTHKYQSLSDALKYAEIDAARKKPDPEAPAPIKTT